MSHFFKDRSNRFWNKLGHEYIAKKLVFIVLVYKHSLENSPLNVYDEEEDEKGGLVFEKPIAANCLIQHEDQEYITDDVTTVIRKVTFGFQREYLKDINLMLEVGDIIEWDDSFYEVDKIVENRYIQSIPTYNFSVFCETHMTERTRLNLENVRSGINNL